MVNSASIQININSSRAVTNTSSNTVQTNGASTFEDHLAMYSSKEVSSYKDKSIPEREKASLGGDRANDDVQVSQKKNTNTGEQERTQETQQISSKDPKSPIGSEQPKTDDRSKTRSDGQALNSSEEESSGILEEKSGNNLHLEANISEAFSGQKEPQHLAEEVNIVNGTSIHEEVVNKADADVNDKIDLEKVDLEYIDLESIDGEDIDNSSSMNAAGSSSGSDSADIKKTNLGDSVESSFDTDEQLKIVTNNDPIGVSSESSDDNLEIKSANAPRSINNDNQAIASALSSLGGLAHNTAANSTLNNGNGVQINVESSVSLDAEQPSLEGDNLNWVMSQMKSSSAEQLKSSHVTSLEGDRLVNGDSLKAVSSDADPELSLESELSKPSLNLEGETRELEADLEIGDLKKKELDSNLAKLFNASSAVGLTQDPNVTQLGNQANASRTPGQGLPSFVMTNAPTAQEWAGEMTQKVSIMKTDGIKTAHIHLDPPELGSLTVKVHVDNDGNAQVSFVASSHAARDAIESQLSRLREMLSQQGMNLDNVDVDVSGGSGSQAGTTTAERNGGQNGSQMRGDEALADEELGDMQSYALFEERRGIDYYA